MAEIKTLALDKILVPERLRLVEEDHALAIQASIVEHGLINPITVRATPAATRPYTLVAGAHRLRAIELLDEEDEIEAIIVKADADEAVLVEITENLFRNELSALDRAMFVMSYREVWERKYGKIEPGRPANRQNICQLIEAEAKTGFSKHVADRLGCSTEAIRLLKTIAGKLSPELRLRLRGTAEADNQSLLIKLARMEPQRQKLVATAFADSHDIKQAIDLTDPNAKAKAVQSAQDELLDRLVATWKRADEKTKAAFLQHIGAKFPAPREKLPTLTELLTETSEAGQ